MPYIGKKPADIIATVIDTTTGTFSGDLTVDTNTLYVDSANNRVGIGTVSPIAPLHVKGTTNGNLYVRAASLAENTLTGTALSSVNDAASATVPLALEGSEFNFVQSNIVKVKVDTSGNVGIGTSSPNKPLTVFTSAATDSARFTDNTNSELFVKHSSGNLLTLATGSTSQPMVFGQGSTERMRIDSSGKVGVGTSSPGVALQVHYSLGTTLDDGVLRLIDDTSYAQNVGAAIALGFKYNSSGNVLQRGGVIKAIKENATDGNYASALLFGTTANGVSTSERMRIDSSGNVGIGTTSPVNNSNRTTLALENVWGGQLDIMVGSTVHSSFGTDNFSSGLSCRIESQDGFTFKTTAGAGELVRIDSSGNFMVSTTENTLYDDTSGSGLCYRPNLSLDIAREATTSGNYMLSLNNTGVDAKFINFGKDGSAVGSIGVDGGDNLYFAGGSGDTRGIYLNNTGLHPASTGGAINDASNDLGIASNRWNNLYLSGGAYIGGTGSANYLDDYEEGTWTPTLGGSTTAGTYSFSVSQCYYTKIGRQVTVIAGLQLGTASGGTGVARFGGLPFIKTTAQNMSGTASTGGVDFANDTLGIAITEWTGGDSIEFSLTQIKDNAGSVSTDIGGISSGDFIRLTITYFTS